MNSENWKPILRYEGLYEASDKGRIRRVGSDNSLVAFTSKNGYLKLTLCKSGDRRNERVHSLVAEAFHGPRPEGFQVNHKDCNKLNNSPENLEFVSQSDHTEHTTKNGLRASGERHGSVTHPGLLKGNLNPNAKLTEDSVKEIKRKLADGVRCKDIAAQYGLDRSAISLIKRGINWKHVSI